MIQDALVFLKNRLNAHMSLGRDPKESREDIVVFMDGENMDPLSFKLGAVTALLINMQEDEVLRDPNLYSRVAPDGSRQMVQPEVRLQLYVLFVARFRQYEDALSSLSQIISYFQENRVFNHHNAPELSDDIEKLLVDLITQPFSEQNEVWNALRLPYHPSVLYEVRTLVFQTGPEPAVPEVSQRDIGVSQ